MNFTFGIITNGENDHYLNEVVNQPQLKKAMAYYLKDLPTTNFYINYIWGVDAQNKSSISDSEVTLEETLLRKYIRTLLS